MIKGPYESQEHFEERKKSWEDFDAAAGVSFSAARMYLHIKGGHEITVREALDARMELKPDDVIEVLVKKLDDMGIYEEDV